MKKKLLALSTLIALATGVSHAQQEKLLTHFIYDKMSLNPGSTGLDEGICGTMIYRNQWDKVNGAPNSAVLNLEANLTRFFPGGVGISAYHDAIGFNRQNNALLNYSFPVDLGEHVLGVGVGFGIVNMGIDPSWIPPVTINDPSLPSKTSGTAIDLNGGLFFKKKNNNYYFGVSSTHLTSSEIKNMYYTNARHYNVMAGYKFMDLFGANKDLDIQVLMRSDLVKYTADVNIRYMHKNKLYAGLTYRTSDAVALMAGFVPARNFTVGYSYDLTINQLASISRGTHEVVVKYCYFLPPPPVQKSKHPRWL
jgi:type IX secretion system PorP/SprF family membrane protein